MYGANICAISEKLQSDIVFSNNLIYLYSAEEHPSKHGMYVEFKHCQYIMTGSYYSISQQFIFRSFRGDVTGLLAFVYNTDVGLCVVDIETDQIKSILTPPLDLSGDFSITVHDQSGLSSRNAPRIIILNEGQSFYYDGIPNNASSINKVKSKAESKKSYSLDGIETKKNKKGVYIRDGKKYLKR